jgi:hypothetical protein
MGRILRIIVVTILVVFALRAVRMIWSALTGGGKTTARGGAGGSGPRQQAEAVPTSGVLRKCAHCGVFISEALALKEAGGKEPVYFCSAECRSQGRGHA